MRGKALVVVTVALASYASALLTGCFLTVSAPPIVAHAPSLDGNQANSGLYGRLGDGGWMVSPGFIARYNGLISDGYGTEFVPPLRQGQGYAPLADGIYQVETHKGIFTNLPAQGEFEMDSEHAADFGVMSRLHASPKKP